MGKQQKKGFGAARHACKAPILLLSAGPSARIPDQELLRSRAANPESLNVFKGSESLILPAFSTSKLAWLLAIIPHDTRLAS
jgi:hypothetical protein